MIPTIATLALKAGERPGPCPRKLGAASLGVAVEGFVTNQLGSMTWRVQGLKQCTVSLEKPLRFKIMFAALKPLRFENWGLD